MLTHASLRTLVSASRFFSAAALSLGLATTSLALPADPALSLDATYGLFPRPAGHQYFPSPQDWRDVNIYQLFTDRFADGDAANNTSQAMGINRTSWFVNNSGRSFPHNRNFHHGGDWKGLKDKREVVQPLWNGANKPDFQIYLAGSLWQGFVSRAVDDVFPVDDGGVNYFKILGGGSATQLGFQANKGALFAGASLWGVDDADARRTAGAPTRNFMAQGHNGSRDSFYEIKIPLSFLGLTRAQLESQGLGVMVGAGSNSAVDVLPQDDGATLNTQGVETWNSSLEWGDVDSITAPFARIGAW